MDEIMDQLNQVIEERLLHRDQGTCPPHGSNSQ